MQEVVDDFRRSDDDDMIVKNDDIHYEKKLTKNIRPTDILQVYTSI